MRHEKLQSSSEFRIVRRVCFVCLAVVALAAQAGEPGGSAPNVEQLLKKAQAVREWNWKHHDQDLTFNKAPDKDAPNLSDAEVKRLADYYRAQYPFQSVRDRLAYEKSIPADRPAPKLSAKTKSWLQTQDKPDVDTEEMEEWRQAFDSQRSYSLSIIHSDNVRKFITQEGFGIQRMTPPRPEMLALPAAKPNRLPTKPALSTEHLESAKVDVPSDEATAYGLIKADYDQIPFDKREAVGRERYMAWAAKHNPLFLPTTPRLATLHDASYNDFASRTQIGLVKDVDHVAGFGGHALNFLPQIDMRQPRDEYFSQPEEQPIDEPTQFWQVRRMNLVSLLKSAQPAVYESENIPAMKELSKAKTRPLDKFETGALEQLRGGENIAVASQTNRILMLGSLRATQRCLECHSVNHGELLGAFSYELIRVKPIAPAPAHAPAGG